MLYKRCLSVLLGYERPVELLSGVLYVIVAIFVPGMLGYMTAYNEIRDREWAEEKKEWEEEKKRREEKLATLQKGWQ